MCRTSTNSGNPTSRLLLLEERVDAAQSLLCEGACLLVDQQQVPLQQQQEEEEETQETEMDAAARYRLCMHKFDRALLLAPHLRSQAVRALYPRVSVYIYI